MSRKLTFLQHFDPSSKGKSDFLLKDYFESKSKKMKIHNGFYFVFNMKNIVVFYIRPKNLLVFHFYKVHQKVFLSLIFPKTLNNYAHF